jgi:Ser/Thr protein kinase RdoA (MazF antagonist)
MDRLSAPADQALEERPAADLGGATAQRVRAMATFYARMRPYVPGKAYINYCDNELQDWPTAYWGRNLARLKGV